MAIDATATSPRTSSRSAARCSSPARTSRRRTSHRISTRALERARAQRRAHGARHRLPAGAVGTHQARRRRDALRRRRRRDRAPAEHPAAVRPRDRHRARSSRSPAAAPTSSRRCKAVRERHAGDAGGQARRRWAARHRRRRSRARSTTRSTAAASTVEVLNVLGAGDAFSAGFLSGWVRGEDYDACTRYANACGALVVSRHGCAPAMPTPRRARPLPRATRDRIPRPDRDATLDAPAPRHRAARAARRAVRVRLRPPQPVLRAGAARPAPARRGCRRSRSCCVEAVAETERARAARGPRRHAVRRPLRPGCAERGDRPRLVDRAAGRAARLAIRSCSTHGRSIGTALIAWPREHVVKCLVALPPRRRDRPPRSRTRRRSRALCEAVAGERPRAAARDHPAEAGCRATPTPCCARVKRLYNLGIKPEWWKLEPMARGGVGSARRADRRARPVLPRRRAARA